MDRRGRAALLRELGHRLPAAPRVAFVLGAEDLLDEARVRHPDLQEDAAQPGANLDLLVAGALDAHALPTWLRCLRPGGTLLVWVPADWTVGGLRAALEGLGYEVVRIGPASRTGAGLRAALGLGTRGAVLARALRPPGTGQH